LILINPFKPPFLKFKF